MTHIERRKQKLQRVLFVLKQYLENKQHPKHISQTMFGTPKKAWWVWETIAGAITKRRKKKRTNGRLRGEKYEI